MNKSSLRINQMEDMIKERSTISVKELAASFHVSEMTIRRDLDSLKHNPRIKNIRGLIFYDVTASPDILPYSISNAVDAHMNEKMRIGQAAAAMVQDNDVIMIDLGSTTEYMAKALNSDCSATVICISYNVLAPLTHNNNLKIHCPGGYFHPDTQMLESPESLSFLKNIRAQKLFASAAGIHKQLGVTCANGYEAPTKKALINSSAERILLIDSSKFGYVQTTYLANIDCYQTIITDTNIPLEWERYLVQQGIHVIKV